MIALQKEIRVQECSSESAYVPPPSISTTAAFSVSTKFTRGIASKKKGLVCAFCKGPHPTHTCESVTDLQKWLEVVKKDNLCYNVWLITRCHSASQDSGVRSARSTIPPCVTVKLNPQDPLMTKQRIVNQFNRCFTTPYTSVPLYHTIVCNSLPTQNGYSSYYCR